MNIVHVLVQVLTQQGAMCFKLTIQFIFLKSE